MGLKIYRVPKNLETPKTNNGVVKCKMKVLNIILKSWCIIYPRTKSLPQPENTWP